MIPLALSAAGLGLVVPGASGGVAGAGQDAREAAIDAVFREWDRDDSPGCAVGALERGQFVFRKGYGIADLDDGIRIGPDSVFRMASVSKQFTAAAVLVAEDLGLLNLEDPLRLHFPDLPDWAGRTRIRHLIHHTSGIRDYLVVMDLRGRGDDAHYTDREVLEALRQLERLNFEPGTEYLYSNAGYWLLARLVLRASGQTLRDFSEEHLFEPLGMHDSHFHDHHREIVPRRAHGYRPREGGGFELDETTLDMVGDGGVYTSVNELAAWERMFLDPASLGPDFVTRMTTPGRFEDGSVQDYAAGLALGEHRGLRTIGHGGSWVGFRTHALRFPDQELAVFVLCNSSSADPGALARRTAEVFLGDAMDPAADAAKPPAAAARLLPGAFYSERLGAALDIEAAGGALFLAGRGSRIPLFDAEGELAASGTTPLRLAPTDDGFVLRQEGQRDFRYRRVEPWAARLDDLVGLAGTYHCRELEAGIEVRVDARPGLTVVFAGGRERPLNPLFLDDSGHSGEPEPVFRFEGGTLRFLPDPADAGRARAVTLAVGRARGFEFHRR